MYYLGGVHIISSDIKKSIKDVLTLKSIYPQVYVVNMKHISNDLDFTNKLNDLGTWIIKDGSEWVCKTDLSEDEFKEKFIYYEFIKL